MSDRGTARGSPLLTPRFPGLHLNFSQLHLVMWLDMGLYEPRSISIQAQKKQSENMANFIPLARPCGCAYRAVPQKSRVKEEKQEDYGLRRS